MTLDAIGLCEPEGDAETPFGTYRRYGIATDVLYPAALEDLRAPADGDPALTDADVALASTPRDDLADPEAIARRATILTRARIHFTNRMIEQDGPGVGLHIRREAADGESAWRL